MKIELCYENMRIIINHNIYLVLNKSKRKLQYWHSNKQLFVNCVFFLNKCLWLPYPKSSSICIFQIKPDLFRASWCFVCRINHSISCNKNKNKFTPFKLCYWEGARLYLTFRSWPATSARLYCSPVENNSQNINIRKDNSVTMIDYDKTHSIL